MSRFIKPLSILVLLLTLAACATVPRPQAGQPLSWQQHQRLVGQVKQWVLNARVSVNSGAQAWSGKLLWQQQGESFQIHFNAPFGQGAFRLEGSPGGVAMHLADGESYYAADAETLIYQQLGWRFPLQQLRYWVMGMPAPQTSPLLGFGADARLATLEQSHWRVRYPDYMQVGEVTLPKKVFLDNSELKVRLVVDRWEMPDGV